MRGNKGGAMALSPITQSGGDMNQLTTPFQWAYKARKAIIYVLVGGSLGVAVLFGYRAFEARINSLETTVQTQQATIVQLGKTLATVQTLTTLKHSKGEELHNTVGITTQSTRESLTSLTQMKEQDNAQGNNPSLYTPIPDSFDRVLSEAEGRARATTHN